MKEITLIMKITSGCNLRCPYCYTAHTLAKRDIMPIETFKKAIQNIGVGYDSVSIIYHGGEPLLAPLSWYKESVEVLERYKRLFGFTYSLSLQSNATLMDDEYNEFFLKHNINVGYSFDGLNNDKTRKSTKKVLENKEKYESLGGCIALITADNWNQIEDEIDYFDELGLSHKFNVVFNTSSEVKDGLADLTKENLLECYKRAFFHVISKETTYSKRMFDLWINHIFNLNHDRMLCCNSNCTGKWLSVHSNGDIYPCGQEWDNFKDIYGYGNINETTFDEVFSSDNFNNFKDKFEKKIEKCKSIDCIAFDICMGGCPGENKANGTDIDSYIDKHCYLNIKFIQFLKQFFGNEDNLMLVKNKYILEKYDNRRV